MKNNNRTYLYAAVAALAISFLGSVSRADEIDFSALTSPAPASFLTFSGGDFSFSTSGAGSDFDITYSDVGGAVGLQGDILGTFKIGAISADVVNGGFTAPVTTLTGGSVEIFDGSGHTLTANLAWDTIHQAGTGDSLNVNGAFNLTDITYSGSNATLLSLKSSGTGADTVSFSFIPSKTLQQIKAATNLTTNYSGKIYYTPDAGSTALLIVLGSAGLALGFVSRRRSALKA